jgi:hypothetical protein
LYRFIAPATRSIETSKGKIANHENSGTEGVGVGLCDDDSRLVGVTVGLELCGGKVGVGSKAGKLRFVQ